MKIHKIAGVLCALQSVTNLGSKCNQTSPERASPPLSYAEFPPPPDNTYKGLVRIYIIEKFNVVIMERASWVGALLLLLECVFPLF